MIRSMPMHALLLIASASIAMGQFTFTANPAHAQVPPDASEIQVDLPFSNTGDHPLEIARTQTDCTCTAIDIQDGKMRYAPGESGVIRATIEIGNKIGEEQVIVVIWLKGDPEEKPSIQIPVLLHIPKLIELSTKSLKWPLNGPVSPQSIHISMHDSKPIHVTKVSSSSNQFSLELVTHEAGNRYEVVVTPLNTNQQGMAIVRVETDSTTEKQKIQQAFAMVIGE